MARKTLGKPRFYADILQYLKALGYYAGSDSPELWTLDPTNNTEYGISSEGDPTPYTSGGGGLRKGREANLEMAIPMQRLPRSSTTSGNSNPFTISNPNKSIDRLLTNVPQSDVSGVYGAVLGHSITNKPMAIEINDYTIEDVAEIANYSSFSAEYSGYSLWSINNCGAEENIDSIRFSILSNESHNTGCVSYGRWFEPEYAFDLKGSVSNSYEGISTQTTVGGHTLSNIKHLGQPHWGNGLPAWTLQKQDDEDYNVGGAKGRRSWQVGFSFLSDDKLFNKEGNPDKFFTYNEDTEQHTFDTSLASFYKLTLNGKLPFIFCPDNDADEKEFALCRITNQPKFSQVANNLWSTSLVITENW